MFFTRFFDSADEGEHNVGNEDEREDPDVTAT